MLVRVIKFHHLEEMGTRKLELAEIKCRCPERPMGYDEEPCIILALGEMQELDT